MLSVVPSFTLTTPWHSLSSTCLCNSTKSPWDCHLSSFSRLQTPVDQKSGLEAPGSSPKPKRDGNERINVHLPCPWGPEVNNSVPCSTLSSHWEWALVALNINLLDIANFPGIFLFPVSWPDFSISASWDQLPNILFAHKYLSQWYLQRISNQKHLLGIGKGCDEYLMDD